MSDCVFCRIAAGEAPAQVVYQDERALAFLDIDPRAPVHVLVIPRKHLDNLKAMGAKDTELAGHLLLVANRVAAGQGMAETGYRLVINVGRDGGESVHHLHVHVLGKRRLKWPPG